MRFDMHTHSESSHDSVCPITDMAKAQKALGTDGFAVTDHCDFEFWETVDIDAVIKSSHEAAEKASAELGIEILKGAEFGEAIWYPEKAKEIMSRYEFDVIIGSVHAARYDGLEMPYSQIDFGKLSDEVIREYLITYFDDVLDMLSTEDVDIAAHITCPLRYIIGKYERNVDCRDFKAAIEKILDCIIRRKIALEVNTSGLSKGSKYYKTMPEEWILEEYKKRGGKLVTVGSDAHVAENASLSFDAAYAMLKKCGFDSCYYYKNRQATEYSI